MSDKNYCCQCVITMHLQKRESQRFIIHFSCLQFAMLLDHLKRNAYIILSYGSHICSWVKLWMLAIYHVQQLPLVYTSHLSTKPSNLKAKCFNLSLYLTKPNASIWANIHQSTTSNPSASSYTYVLLKSKHFSFDPCRICPYSKSKSHFFNYCTDCSAYTYNQKLSSQYYCAYLHWLCPW